MFNMLELTSELRLLDVSHSTILTMICNQLQNKFDKDSQIEDK